MILNAEILDTFDRCPRKLAFSQKWEPRAISPLGLLYTAIESALISPDPEQSAKDETLRIAKSREISTDQNAFTVTRHIGFLAAILVTVLQSRLGQLTRVPATEEWESNLFSTPSGDRHKILLVSALDDDRLRAAAHSWAVIGELVALQSPLTLTAVVIGSQRAGKRHCAWAKGYIHPKFATKLRFRERGAKEDGFGNGWLTIWREQRGEISTEKWISTMAEDGVLDSLIISRTIPFNAEDNRMKIARRDMLEIGEKIKSAREDAPMKRCSCDSVGHGACVWQSVCWSPTETSPDQLPQLYRPISSAARS